MLVIVEKFHRTVSVLCQRKGTTGHPRTMRTTSTKFQDVRRRLRFGDCNTILRSRSCCTDACTIVFKENGPPINYKFQVHNIAHARLLEAPVHKVTQWNHVNMLYFEIKYVIEWDEGFIIAASMPLKIEITIKVMYTKFIEKEYKIYRNKINKKAK